MNDKMKRDAVNKNTRYVAYKVFYRKERYMFINAFDKLNARVQLDHDISIQELAGDTQRGDYNLFDVLSGDELDMVLDSSMKLRNMYDDVIAKKSA